jgi:hypothetical protein
VGVGLTGEAVRVAVGGNGVGVFAGVDVAVGGGGTDVLVGSAIEVAAGEMVTIVSFPRHPVNPAHASSKAIAFQICLSIAFL